MADGVTLNAVSGSVSAAGSAAARGARALRAADGEFSQLVQEMQNGAVRPAAVREKDGASAIDKTSALYEQALELESYFIKTLLSSARKALPDTSLFGDENSSGRAIYDDMMWDAISEAAAKNASLGLADLIYIELSSR